MAADNSPRDPGDDFVDDSAPPPAQQGGGGADASGAEQDPSIRPDQVQATGVDPEAETVAPKDKPVAPPPTPKVKPKPAASSMNSRQYRGYIIVGAIVIIGLGSIIAFAKNRGSTTVSAPPVIKPTYDASPDVDAKFQRFMNEIKDSQPTMQRRQDDMEERLKSGEKLVRDAVSRMEEMQRAQDAKYAEQMRKIQQVLDAAGASGKSTSGAAGGDLDGFVTMLKKQKGTSGLNLQEARIRLDQFLKNQGFDGGNLALLRDQSLDQLGFLYVGDVAELPLSDRELADLPEGMREPTKALRDYFLQNGEFAGRVLLREDEGEKWLRTTYGDVRIREAGAAVPKAIFLARVRKDNVTREMEEMLPDLAAERDKRGIAPGDLFRTEAFVYELKKSRFPAMRPGQHLSMTFALAGLRSNPSGDQAPKQRALNADDRSMLEGIGRDAVKFGLAQGAKQDDLLRRAKDAIGAKAADMRVQTTAVDIEQMALAAVAAAVRGSQSGPATAQVQPQPVSTGTVMQADKPAADRKRTPGVRLGSIDVPQSDAPMLGWVVAAAMAERLKLDPGKPADAAAFAAMLTASTPLAKATWQAVAERDGDLRQFISLLIGDLQQAANEARSIALPQVTWPGISADDAAYVLAIELGRVRGAHQASDGDALRAAVDRRRKELVAAPPRIEDMPSAVVTGRARFLATWRALNLPAPPGIGHDRAEVVLSVLGKQLQERRIAHESVELDVKPELREKAVRELNDNLVGTVPAVLTLRDDRKMPEGLLEQAVVAGHNRYAVASLSETMLATQGVQFVTESLATAIDRDELIGPLYAAMASWVPDEVHALIEAKKPAITDQNLGALSMEIAAELTPAYREYIAKRIISGNLTDRLTSTAGTLQKENLVRALKHLEDRLGQARISPVTIKQVDELSITLHDECMGILRGAAAPGAGRAAQPVAGGGKPAPTRPGFFDVKDEGLPGVPAGAAPPAAGAKTRAIIRGSAFNVYLEIGAVVAVGGKNEFDDRVQLRGRGGFFSPAGKWFPFPPVVFQGRVKSNASGDRNNVQIEHMSVEFPNGRVIEKEVTGIVTDEIDGIGGMIAEYDRNLDKILPEAATLSVIEGAGAALSATQETTTVVVPGSTTQSSSVGSAAQLGLGEGFKAGADLLTEYQRQYLSSISPTTETPNGQKLVAYMFSTIEFADVTEEDWASIEETQYGRSWNGF